MIGMHGTVSAAWAVERSDLLICIGARFSDRVATNPRRFAPKARIIHIDIDDAEINKNIGVDYAGRQRRGELPAKAAALCAARGPRPVARADRGMAPHAGLYPQGRRQRAQAASGHQDRGRDGGRERDHRHRTWVSTRCGRRSTAAATRSISSSPRAAWAPWASATAPRWARSSRTRKRPSLHITSDGSFHMNMNELATAVSYNLPIITILMNNQVLAWCTSGRRCSMSVATPRPSPSARPITSSWPRRSAGRGFRVTNLAELRAAMKDALQRTGPVVIDCRIGPRRARAAHDPGRRHGRRYRGGLRRRKACRNTSFP